MKTTDQVPYKFFTQEVKDQAIHQNFSGRISLLVLTAGFVGLFLLSGCSAVKFTADSSCSGSTNCVNQNGTLVYEDTVTVGGGKVDVLIVDDNSASMSFEQAHLAQRFNQFVSQFDQKYIDYRIAVTTTDISSNQNLPRTINQNGALQDGRLITFSNSQKYLTSTSGTDAQKEQMFNTIINRPETLSCEQFILNWQGSRDTVVYSQGYYDACPSTDERGVYAANLVIQNNPDGFIRPDADLAIIFLSDEDERSQLYWFNTPGYELADFDKASTLVSQVQSKYPQKAFSAHAIIVKDQNCLDQQNAQMNGLVSGSFGWDYYNATQATGGVAGDICATDYTSQLSSIFNNIQGKIVDKIALNCAAPQLQVEDITVSSNDPSITSQVVGSTIQFSKKLPAGSTVHYKYKCLSSAQ